MKSVQKKDRTREGIQKKKTAICKRKAGRRNIKRKKKAKSTKNTRKKEEENKTIWSDKL